MFTRNVLLVLLPALLFVAPAANASPSADHQAIAEALDRWLMGWEVRDPKLAAQDYSQDADWTNAFGATRKGRTEIQAMLIEVFAMDFVMAGDTFYHPPEIRIISDSLALVRTIAERKGQKMSTGAELGIRQTTHLRVFEKRTGRWQIISHLISDARSTQKPAH